jgi:hypothetical protein
MSMAMPTAKTAEVRNQTATEDKINADLDNDELQRRLILEPVLGWVRRQSSYCEE